MNILVPRYMSENNFQVCGDGSESLATLYHHKLTPFYTVRQDTSKKPVMGSAWFSCLLDQLLLACWHGIFTCIFLLGTICGIEVTTSDMAHTWWVGHACTTNDPLGKQNASLH